MRAIVLIVAILGLSAVCSGQSTRSYSPGCGLGARWDLVESGWTGTWVRRGSSNTFDASWGKGGASGSSVITMTLTGDRVHVDRRDAAEFGGASVAYDATIAADGTVSGTGRVASSGATYTFHATVTCGDLASTSVQPPPVKVDGGGGVAPGCGLGARWDLVENGWAGTWVRRGRSNTFDASWGKDGAGGSSVITMTLTGSQVRIERRDSAGFGGAAVSYDATIAADETVSGTGRVASSGAEYAFRARVLCGDTAGTNIQLPAVTFGVRYRVENFVYDAPDVFQNPRNYHDFMIDFTQCSIREMNQESDQGLEQIHVSVCRKQTRLTFTTVTPNSAPVEYDWLFLNDGKTISGAYRHGNTFGPSVGGKYNP